MHEAIATGCDGKENLRKSRDNINIKYIICVLPLTDSRKKASSKTDERINHPSGMSSLEAAILQITTPTPNFCNRKLFFSFIRESC